jgi:methylated-DNA-protein-cysteine methyltransferase-like protein
MDCAVKQGSKSSLKRGAQKRWDESSPDQSSSDRSSLEQSSLDRSSLDQSSRTRIGIEAAIRRIPKGKVSTYGAVARAAGFPGAARQVARVLHRGFGLPWQRVLGAGGEIKLRGDSAVEQRLRLEAEGVRFRGRKVDMKQCEFKSARASGKKKKST